MTTKQRYQHIIDYFQKQMPVAESELNYSNAFELLVAVMLSAQCTDKRVNMVTPKLLHDYPTTEAMARATPEVIYEYIKSVSYPNNKARHLCAMAHALMENFGGKVPSTSAELQTLPGVGRKTANVVAAVFYGENVMPVDTHIFRVSARIGFTPKAKTPTETELELEKNIPKNLLPIAHHWLLLHGRYVCTARSPKCEECGIAQWCKMHTNK